MSAPLEGNSISRFVLAPATLAVLIAGPLASTIAGQWGVSWWVVFLVSSGVLAIFWDIAILREPNGVRILAEKDDPVFGHLNCFQEGRWEVGEPVQLEGAWISVAIEAGEGGPSTAQQDTFQAFLKHPAQYRDGLVETLIRQTGDDNFPGLTPTRLFLPEVCEEGTDLEIEVHVDGDSSGPHAEVVGFHEGQTMQGKDRVSTTPLPDCA
ncbi:MAG: hypothetical protein GY930_17965 [bacterium]|nr:hypothetical protein [bacterium]